MPFKSQAQAAWLKEHKPGLYKEFAAATPKATKLPKHAKLARPKNAPKGRKK
jgi:hypothetical protein